MFPHATAERFRIAERHQRRLGAAFDGGEGDEQHDGGREGSESERVGPGVLGGVGQSEDQGQQAEGDRGGAGHIQPLLRGGLAFGEDGGSDEEHGDGDGDVDEERPAPIQQIGQQPAKDGAGGEACSHEGSVEAECLVPQGPCRKGTEQQRQGGGHDDGGGNALPDAGDQQQGGVCGQAAGRGRGAEQGHANQ